MKLDDTVLITMTFKKKETAMNDWVITNFIVGMGLSLSLAVYIAFRAGRRLRGLTPENMEEKVTDFTFDSLKGLISDQLEGLFGAQGVHLPAGITIQDVAAYLHNDREDILQLQGIYESLQLGIVSPHHEAALQALATLTANLGL